MKCEHPFQIITRFNKTKYQYCRACKSVLYKWSDKTGKDKAIGAEERVLTVEKLSNK